MKYLISLVMVFAALHVMAQESSEPFILQGLHIDEERAQLDAKRKRASDEFKAAKKACYQKIAVTACIERAQQVKNAQDNEHKRLSLILNEAERQQRGANAQRRLDDKQSPEKQAEREEQRADRMRQQSETFERHVDKNEQQQDKINNIQQNRDERAKHVQEVLDRQQKHQEKLRAAQESRDDYQRKLDAAQRHRAQVQADKEARKSGVAPLPAPSTTSP